MNIPIPRVPDITHPQVLALCKTLVSNPKPIYLQVENVKESIINECYGNVEKIIKKEGGNIQYGWQLWEPLPGVMIEAEFHAVWVDQFCNYHDVTPKEIPNINKILFLPDLLKKYEGKQIDNVRIALVNDPVVDKYIESEKLYFEVMNEGDLAYFHGYIEPTEKMIQIAKQKRSLGLEIIQKYFS